MNLRIVNPRTSEHFPFLDIDAGAAYLDITLWNARAHEIPPLFKQDQLKQAIFKFRSGLIQYWPLLDPCIASKLVTSATQINFTSIGLGQWILPLYLPRQKQSLTKCDLILESTLESRDTMLSISLDTRTNLGVPFDAPRHHESPH